jgi:hypothetical protein
MAVGRVVALYVCAAFATRSAVCEASCVLRTLPPAGTFGDVDLWVAEAQAQVTQASLVRPSRTISTIDGDWR